MDIALVLNLRAGRGSEAVLRACRQALPGARILASRTLEDAARFARELSASPPELLIAGGGDGTAVALVNALRECGGERGSVLGSSGSNGRRKMPLGVLPLGTGNAWAHATGARRWRGALDSLARNRRGAEDLPVRRFDLVEVDGTVGHFAGTGWDAELIDDFHAQKQGPSLLPESARARLPGYLVALTTRMIPRHLRSHGRPQVEITNTGDDALTIDDEGRVVPVVGGKSGAVLYRGPASVCSAGTTPEWGFRFRAFPFAGAVERRFCFRVYGAGALEATLHSPALWRGVHPLPKMHTWMLTGARAVFSRPVAFQIGGDRHGWRTEIDYRLANEQVDLLDWEELRRAA